MRRSLRDIQFRSFDGLKSVNIKFRLAQRRYLMRFSLLIFLVQFHFEPFSSYLKSIHFFDRIKGRSRVFKTDESDSFAFSVLFCHNSRAQNIAEFFKKLIQLRVLHVVGKMEQKKVASWGPEFSLGILHVV